MPNPVGADGWVTKLGERVPGVNKGIQKLHERAGKKEALDRARRVNPVGPHGKLTKLGELTPGVNNVIQHLHRKAGQEEALHRAKDRNPLGGHGWLTIAGEQVPGVSDGIEALHIRAGKHDDAERAGGKSLSRMLGKDGMVTKIAEVIPGLNLVAAAVHDVSGNDDEADRALNLLRTWKEAGSPDGALAKIAEYLPVTDVVAFALHLKSGHIPQALRSITKTSYVHVKARSVLCSAHVGSVQTIGVLSYEARDLKISPRSPSMVGALMDVVVNLLEMDRNGNMRRRRLSRSSASSSSRAVSKGKRERFKEQTDAAITSMVNEAIHNAIDFQIERAPRTLGLCRAGIEKPLGCARARRRLLRALLPEALPHPSRQLVAAVQEGAADIRGHHEAIGPVEPVRQPGARCRRAPELAAGASCLGFAGCCLLGLKTGCLAVAAGAVAGVAQLGKEAAARAAPWLNSQNRRAWEDSVAHPKFTSPSVPASSSTARPASSSSAWPASRSSAGPASSTSGPCCGFTVSVEPGAAKEISGLLRSYIFDQFYADHWLRVPLEVLERPLKWWASRVLVPTGDTAPLAVAIQVPEQIVPDLPWDLWLPDFPLLLVLDVDLWSRGRGPYLQGARLAIADAVVDRIVEAVRVQVEMWDLRDADPRLRDLCEPLQVTFGVDLKWPSPVQLNVEVIDFATTLHLPT